MTTKLPDLILVVDDNEIKRYTTRRILENAGFHVEEIGTATATLARLRDREKPVPDLLILDVKLPDMNGFDLCRKIKANPATGSILVCHLSAHLTSFTDHVRGLESGADAYLTVPVEPEVLTATVRSLARLARAERVANTAARHWGTTFDAITDAICLLDGEGSIVRCNRAMTELFRLPAHLLLDTTLRDLAQEILSVTLNDLVTLPGENNPIPERQVTEVALPGQRRWLRITADRVQEGETEVGHMVCVFSDITPRKLLEEELHLQYEREKRIAESFQSTLLTPPPNDAFSGFDMETFYMPAWNEAQVGGDFFDAFLIGEGDEKQLAVVIGDASGKGLEAALRAAEVKHILRAIVWETPDPADALRRMNKYVCSMEEERETTSLSAFLTLVLVIIDKASGLVRFCRAGADPPVLIGASHSQAETAATGLPLGIHSEAEFETVDLPMAEGDILLLATDGVTEARQKQGGRTEFFGTERLIEVAQEAYETTETTAALLPAVGNAILDAARAFAGGTFQDDVCLLLVRRQEGSERQFGMTTEK